MADNKPLGDMTPYSFTIEGREHPVTVYARDPESAAAEVEKAYQNKTLPPQPVTLSGMGKQAWAQGASAVSGIADVANWAERKMNQGTSAATRGIYNMVTGHDPEPGSYLARGIGIGENTPTTNATEQLHEAFPSTNRMAENPYEEGAGTVGSFVPWVAGGWEGGLMGLLKGGVKKAAQTLGKQAVVPGVASELTGQGVRKAEQGGWVPNRPQWVPDWVPDAETSARILSAVAAPSVADKGRSIITPNPVKSPARQQAADIFDNHDIPYYASARTGSGAQRGREERAGASDLPTKEGFSKAALEKVGHDTPYWSVMHPDTGMNALETAAVDIGGMFKQVEHHAIDAAHPDVRTALVSDLRKIWPKFKNRTSPSTRTEGVKNMLTDIGQDISNGTISGPKYQNYITQMREMAQNAGHPEMEAFGAMREALSDAMEKSIALKGATQDLGIYKTARSRWRDLNVLDDAAASPQSKEGLIHPDALSAAVKRQGGKRAYVEGQRDLAQLSQAGSLLMSKLPTSAADLPGQITRALIGAAGGGTTGYHIGRALFGDVGGPIGGGVGAMVTPTISAITKGLPLSKIAQWHHTNELLGPAGPSGGVLRALSEGAQVERDSRRAKPKAKSKSDLSQAEVDAIIKQYTGGAGP